MIAVDLESYFSHTGTIRDGVRIMQWSNYVKRRMLPLSAKEELELLSRDERLMGSLDWWYKP